MSFIRVFPVTKMKSKTTVVAVRLYNGNLDLVSQ